MKIRPLLVSFAALASAAWFVASPGAPAKAAPNTIHFLLENVASGKCLIESGLQSGTYEATCPLASSTMINHSFLWSQNISGQIINMHSGYCLIVTGASAGTSVWLTGPANNCGQATVDEWSFGSESATNEFTNDHSHLCMTEVSGSLEQTACGDGSHWYETPTDSAD
jgi:hypothetical protein